MNEEKQKLLLEYLAGNPDLWARCQHIIKPSYWDLDLQDVLRFVIDYNAKYKALPDFDKISAETGVEVKPKEITGDTMEYAANEIEVFCRHQEIKSVGKKLPELLSKEDYGSMEKLMRDAITISLHRDIGLDYFHDVETRLRNMKQNERVISTGWKDVDRILGGGITRKELLMFLGESGGGKSIAMLNLARNLMAQGYNGVYYTLELSQEVVAQRMDMLISGYPFRDILKHIDTVSGAVANQGLKMGKFLIKQFPASTTTVHDLVANIKEIQLVEGFIPDFIVIDYLDLMAPLAKVSGDNLFIREKYIAEEVRNLGFEFDAMVISASQMNRSAINSENHDQSMISGGISKINTAGWVISLKRNETMKNAGEVQFQYLKTRSSNGTGKRHYMDWNERNLLITDSSREDFNDIQPDDPAEAVEQEITPVSSKKLHNKIDKIQGFFGDGDED